MRAGAALVLGAALAAAPMAVPMAGPVHAQGLRQQHTVLDARLVQPTGRYDHGVLGDTLEWGGLAITYKHCAPCRGFDRREVVFRLPETRVFEDVEARVVDADGDGLREVLVVETDIDRGASLAVWGPEGRRAATAFVGRRRWLAPAGVGDFDGDGRPEIAYVDRPHLARELVFVRLEGRVLREVARAAGFSNHRIGERVIASEVRRCGGREVLVLPDAGGARAVAVRLEGGRIVAAEIGPRRGAGLPPGCP